MKAISDNPSLKEINAYKKQLCWGDPPAIYHMLATSIGELDGILSYGFDNAYKRLLDRHNWNLSLLEGSTDYINQIEVVHKPKIALKHFFTNVHYEMHCYPIVDGEKTAKTMVNDANCPFIRWLPEVNQRLFRVSSLVTYMIYSLDGGDEADLALIKFTYRRVEQLIETLRESFDIVDIKGYTIAEFYQEISRRKGTNTIHELLDSQPTTE